MIHDVAKPTKHTIVFQSTCTYDISLHYNNHFRFQICAIEDNILFSSTEINQVKPNQKRSFEVPISCAFFMYMIFISNVQRVYEKPRLVTMYNIRKVFWTRNESEFVGFLTWMYRLLSDWYGNCLKSNTFFIMSKNYGNP